MHVSSLQSVGQFILVCISTLYKGKKEGKENRQLTRVTQK